MVYVGVLPYAVNPENGEFYLLLGREHPEEGWDDQNKWAHFGGGMESSDLSPLMGSAREAYEESMGFLGSFQKIAESLSENYLVQMEGIYVYLMVIPFNPELPRMYSDVYQYFLRCAVKHPYKIGHQYLASCPEGYFEKTAIDWFPVRSLYELIQGKPWNLPTPAPILRRGFGRILQGLFQKYNMRI